MKDLMLDLETLGTSHSAVITQIGACYFDRTGKVGDKFIDNVEINSCVDAGLTFTPDTILWWFEQEGRSWMKNASPLRHVLNEFFDFCSHAEFVWCHAPFDAPILMNAYRAINHKPPFSYRFVHDIRTLVHLSGVTKEEQKNTTLKKTHNALDDCLYQVDYCVKCFKALNEPNKK